MFYSGVKYKKGIIFYSTNKALRALLYTIGFAITDDQDILKKQKDYASVKYYDKIAEITWIDSDTSLFNVTPHSSGNWTIELGYPPNEINVTLNKLIEFVEKELA